MDWILRIGVVTVWLMTAILLVDIIIKIKSRPKRWQIAVKQLDGTWKVDEEAVVYELKFSSRNCDCY